MGKKIVLGDPKEIFFSVLPEVRKIAFEIKHFLISRGFILWCMGAGAGAKRERERSV